MQPAGWVTMLLSIGAVLSLLGYCLYRVFSLPASDIEDIEGPLTIETNNTGDAD